MSLTKGLLTRAPESTEGGWIGSWSPGMGDPTLMGWVTVILYFVTAFQCFRLARGLKVKLVRREAICWWVLAGGLFFLGINKQLDLQSALTEFGRIMAHRQGWYESRHDFQKAFVIQLAVLMVGAVLVLGWLVRKAPLPTRAALAGALLLAAFVAIRATSFHHVDLLINSRFLGLRTNWILEIGGILVVLAATWARLKSTGGADQVRAQRNQRRR